MRGLQRERRTRRTAPIGAATNCTKRGQAAYRQRGSTIGPVFGQMEGRGLNRFLLRGKTKVRGEWSLFCTTHDLLKLWRSGWRPDRRSRAAAWPGALALAAAT